MAYILKSVYSRQIHSRVVYLRGLSTLYGEGRYDISYEMFNTEWSHSWIVELMQLKL